jgi:hypothetical protein
MVLKLHSPLSWTTLAYYDNVSAVYFSTNLIQQQHTKYVEIDLHFVRERVAIGDVCVLHVPTTSQFVDIFTEFRSSLNICNGYNFHCTHTRAGRGGGKVFFLSLPLLALGLGVYRLFGPCVWGRPNPNPIYMYSLLWNQRRRKFCPFQH